MARLYQRRTGALNVESTVHRTYSASYGITDEQISTRWSAFARAYTSNILSIAAAHYYPRHILACLLRSVYADYDIARHNRAEHVRCEPVQELYMCKTDEFWAGFR